MPYCVSKKFRVTVFMFLFVIEWLTVSDDCGPRSSCLLLRPR